VTAPRPDRPTPPGTAPDDELLLDRSTQGTFEPQELDGLPGPVARYFAAAIAPGTPLARAVRLSIRGHIKIGRWLPFSSTEVLDPHRGFVWRARVAGRLIVGSDRYVHGSAEMRWRLLGLVPLIHAEGPDLARSAVARAGAEGIWLPTAMLPRYGVGWSAEDDDAVTARVEVNGTPVELHHRLDANGRIRSTVFNRWGDPDRSGTWGWHRCGGDVTGYGTFAGLTIPTAGRLGWHYGTGGWARGEFFRYAVTRLDLPPPVPVKAVPPDR
jgi:hypothetical protein